MRTRIAAVALAVSGMMGLSGLPARADAKACYNASATVTVNESPVVDERDKSACQTVDTP